MHLQFLQWTDFLQPLLVSSLPNLSIKEKSLVYIVIQVAWTEPLMSMVLGLRRDVFPVIAFLGESIILYKVHFEIGNLHQMGKGEEQEISGS